MSIELEPCDYEFDAHYLFELEPCDYEFDAAEKKRFFRPVIDRQLIK